VNPIRRWLADLSASDRAPRAARRSPLKLEALEAREVPAALIAAGIEPAVVGNFYTEILGREAGPGEVDAWVARLQSGATPDVVARGFLGSAEYHTRRVGELYQTAFGRPADAGGQGFVDLLQRGGTERQVLAALLGSAEFNAMHPANADFVAALYQKALNRAPEAGEQALYLNHLTAGRTRAELVGAVVNSPERARAEVTDLFQRFLGRPADAGPLNNMANALTAGAVTLADLAALIASSEENQSQAVARTAAPAPTGQGQGQVAPPATPPAVIAPPVDTDGDGLTDDQERAGWAITVTRADGTTATRRVTSDPTKKDTDGDTIGDAQERALGTDPTATDTDGDTIADPAEAIARTVTFTKADGTTATRQVTSSPVKADTDGDGLDDSREKALGTDPGAADTDADALTDAREVTIGSDPLKADTDADDLTDGEEIIGWMVTVKKLNGAVVTRQATSDPTKKDTDGDGLEDRREKGLGTDPRTADTDADALSDLREVTE
ncbi:MAG: DUF4214 domain-containing protein, partial [Gemmataceae bacterium]|nr:DUF4214 domain-containing protein [Gemmataceae bacterium]